MLQGSSGRLGERVAYPEELQDIWEHLTPMWRRVTELRAQGHTVLEVAEILGLSDRSVEDYSGQIADMVPGDDKPAIKLSRLYAGGFAGASTERPGAGS